MIMWKKTIAFILAALMVLMCVSATAEVQKQEKVYVVARPDGTVVSLTDNVHLVNPDGLDVISDRTLLTGIENLDGDQAFSLDGETLVWQTGGSDIIYQGTSDKVPAMVPVVTLTLNGETVTAEELKIREGDVVLTVTWPAAESVPMLALIAMPLPETGVTGLKAEHGTMMTVMGRQVLLGVAVPGMDPMIGLPASFTATFHADHAELGWMMTCLTSDPIRTACRVADGKISFDPETELNEWSAILGAVIRGDTIPETGGKKNTFTGKLNELNSGMAQLDEGACQVAAGAKELAGSASAEGTPATGLAALCEGSAELDTGLTTLVQNNNALVEGAQRIFAAALDTANAQIAASGLAAVGIQIPTLTAENYAEVLDAVIAKLDPADPTASAYNALVALKAQLDELNRFVQGVKDYTDGTARAAEGAARLNTGLILAKSGADRLAEGAGTLYTGGTQVLQASVKGAEMELAKILMPYVQAVLPQALRIFRETGTQAGNGHYDLAPEDMTVTTLYLYRTDF